jgi:hypothetical protein
MRYEKPEVVVMGNAIVAIQSGNCSKGTATGDSNSPCSNKHLTNGAYEADE